MTQQHTPATLDAVVVGAGFAGLYMLYRLREMGLQARVLEAGSGIGGTWFWNRYPGARCDIESMEYSYQFSEALQQEWEWSERYAPQPEILRYLNHVADRFDLRSGIQLNTRVETAHYDEEADYWAIDTDGGEQLRTRFFIMATGCLSCTNTPQFKGLDNFVGDWYHTGDWPHEPVNFTGKRVGVIGTGSSAIQAIPIIAGQAAQLHVFQRTPNYSLPARNAPIDSDFVAQIKGRYAEFRAENNQSPYATSFQPTEALATEDTPAGRAQKFEAGWQHGGLGFIGCYADMLIDASANETAGAFLRRKIQHTIKDAETAEILSPRQVVGCKRLCLDTGYYETFNEPHVQLVDISQQPIDEITPNGLRVGEREYEFDCLVFATGFDAMTGALTSVDIRGKNTQSLKDKWTEGPQTYLGLSTAGFPNFFFVSGPGSPSVLSNMVPSIEQHVNWISDCIGHMKTRQLHRIEADAQSEQAWGQQVGEIAAATLFPTCNSWYLGANIPGKPRVFMPYLGFSDYVAQCEDVVANDYRGFSLN